MTKLEIAKRAINIAVVIGTGKIVSQVVSNNTNPENVIDEITVTAGSLAIGGLVAAETAKYTDAKIDEIADWWKKNVTK